MTVKMTCQEQFDAWAQAAPREWSIEKQSELGTFPGQYRAYHVQVAWEAWEALWQQFDEQKPVAWYYYSGGGKKRHWCDDAGSLGLMTPVFARPIPAESCLEEHPPSKTKPTEVGL